MYKYSPREVFHIKLSDYYVIHKSLYDKHLSEGSV
jgi:hypothetical protein